jgi:hypothetical protein
MASVLPRRFFVRGVVPSSTSLRLVLMVSVAVAGSAAGQRAIFGQWRVTSSWCPAQCAMTRAEAAAWRGHIATYSDTLARFAEHRCERPRYLVGYWPASGVYGGAHLRDLGIAGDSAMVVEVRCPAQAQGEADPRWQVPGAFLVVKDPAHLWMVWGGVYFQLTQQ